jgi:hypothetical protein
VGEDTTQLAAEADDLEAQYREAASDVEAEAEALAWIEASLNEAFD